MRYHLREVEGSSNAHEVNGMVVDIVCILPMIGTSQRTLLW
ncbi:unnamed protein product [Nezara viridula]|uniref:Uncharacterized protein n=1 Tax=Nezara viridula TaxID=85310 RepID=A0A9P0HCU8_NEZVI|nr:unnamed protein product [Nezara viridula]